VTAASSTTSATKGGGPATPRWPLSCAPLTWTWPPPNAASRSSSARASSAASAPLAASSQTTRARSSKYFFCDEVVDLYAAGHSLLAFQYFARRNRTAPVAALDLAAAELADGRSVPPNAAALLARTPIPMVPFSAWCRFFASMGGRDWRRQAAGNGVDRAALLARPSLAGSAGGAAAAR
jgi:hypothetical protein